MKKLLGIGCSVVVLGSVYAFLLPLPIKALIKIWHIMDALGYPAISIWIALVLVTVIVAFSIVFSFWLLAHWISKDNPPPPAQLAPAE